MVVSRRRRRISRLASHGILGAGSGSGAGSSLAWPAAARLSAPPASSASSSSVAAAFASSSASSASFALAASVPKAPDRKPRLPPALRPSPKTRTFTDLSLASVSRTSTAPLRLAPHPLRLGPSAPQQRRRSAPAHGALRAPNRVLLVLAHSDPHAHRDRLERVEPTLRLSRSARARAGAARDVGLPRGPARSPHSHFPPPPPPPPPPSPSLSRVPLPARVDPSASDSISTTRSPSRHARAPPRRLRRPPACGRSAPPSSLRRTPTAEGPCRSRWPRRRSAARRTVRAPRRASSIEAATASIIRRAAACVSSYRSASRARSCACSARAHASAAALAASSSSAATAARTPPRTRSSRPLPRVERRARRASASAASADAPASGSRGREMKR